MLAICIIAKLLFGVAVCTRDIVLVFSLSVLIGSGKIFRAYIISKTPTIIPYNPKGTVQINEIKNNPRHILITPSMRYRKDRVCSFAGFCGAEVTSKFVLVNDRCESIIICGEILLIAGVSVVATASNE
jgi:hypothetical protein